MKFLHERRMAKGVTLGLENKENRSLYNKARKIAKRKLDEETDANCYVTKSAYELVTGHKPENGLFHKTKTFKYINKYGEYRGKYAVKERR